MGRVPAQLPPQLSHTSSTLRTSEGLPQPPHGPRRGEPLKATTPLSLHPAAGGQGSPRVLPRVSAGTKQARPTWLGSAPRSFLPAEMENGLRPGGSPSYKLSPHGPAQARDRPPQGSSRWGREVTRGGQRGSPASPRQPPAAGMKAPEKKEGAKPPPTPRREVCSLTSSSAHRGLFPRGCTESDSPWLRPDILEAVTCRSLVPRLLRASGFSTWNEGALHLGRCHSVKTVQKGKKAVENLTLYLQRNFSIKRTSLLLCLRPFTRRRPWGAENAP